jgi:hypothetical protein
MAAASRNQVTKKEGQASFLPASRPVDQTRRLAGSFLMPLISSTLSNNLQSPIILS